MTDDAVIFVDSYNCKWFMMKCDHCGEIRPVIEAVEIVNMEGGPNTVEQYPSMLCYGCLKEGGNKGEPPYRLLEEQQREAGKVSQ